MNMNTYYLFLCRLAIFCTQMHRIYIIGLNISPRSSYLYMFVYEPVFVIICNQPDTFFR